MAKNPQRNLLKLAFELYGKFVQVNWLKNLLLITLVIMVSGTAMLASADRKLFRYKDKNGTVVINDVMPPEYAKGGYDILSELGQVLEVVPRQLSQYERDNLSSEEARRQNAIKEEEKLRAWDESLLMRYSDIADIEYARDRQIKELEIRLSILNGNLLATKSQIERQRAKAADMERQGRKVPETLTESIAARTLEIDRVELSIEQREKEIDEIKASYLRDIERFTYLLDIKGYRR